MNRRTILIILSAVLFALLVGFLWFWFFSRSGQEAPAPGGGFGTGQERPAGTGQTGGTGGNIPSNVLPAGGGQTSGAGGIGVDGSGSVPAGSIDPVPGVASVPGVDWLGGTGGTVAAGGGPTTSFVPSNINQLNNGLGGGNVSVLGSFGGGAAGTQGNNGLGLEGALIGAAAGVAACTAGFTPGALAGLGIGIANRVTSVPVSNIPTETGAADTALRENFLNCIARVAARAALDQMTASIVNWINSGFEGKPSFVQNYQQFFTNVADQAAGEFIRGSALSFLCSPFQAQVKIAIAQSYARRNNAASCTLSGALNNIDRATSGGWASLLSLTTTPTNNPYGAYAYGQIQLGSYQSEKVNLSKMRISPEGYLAYEEKYDCQPPAGAPQADGTAPKPVCKTRITTPGSTIASVMSKTLEIPADSLNMAKNFDEIISALLRQLVTKTLQSGLSNVSGPQGNYADYYLTPNQQEAQTKGQALLENLQGMGQYAQQYGTIWQGAIRDVQAAQEQLNSLANCWSEAGAVATDESRKAQAESRRVASLATLASYNAQIETYNANITKANAATAKLQDLQTRTLKVNSTSDVEAIVAEYNAAYNSGQILTQTDVTTAQQDRTALQSTLATRNQQTAAELQQCYAF